MNLVIVESPTKARKLKGYLGSSYQIEASVGHVRDLPKSGLGVDVDNNFEPEYEISKGKNKVVALLRKQAKSADKIFLAMDPDREGEAIAWHVQFLLGDKKKLSDSRFHRATFHEITKNAVEAAIENPTKLNMDLVNAQQARRVLDRLVGYKISPVLWKKVRRGLSAGRVQSVAMRLVVEREREIEAFKPDEYWEVQVGLSTKKLSLNSNIFVEGKPVEPAIDNSIVVDLDKVNGKKFSADNHKIVDPMVSDLKQADYVVSDVSKSERSKQSYPPFITSTLQQSAANKFGFSARQTMSIAQQLYEEGLITYHRTDSFNLASSAVAAARDYIGAEFGSKYVPEKPRFFSRKSKNAQEAHEAIRVTDPHTLPEKIGFLGQKFTARHQKTLRFNLEEVLGQSNVWGKVLSNQYSGYSQGK